MRSWSFNAFPHCATSQFYTTACESRHRCEVQVGVTIHCYGHGVVMEGKVASYHIVIGLLWDTAHMMVMQEAIHFRR